MLPSSLDTDFNRVSSVVRCETMGTLINEPESLSINIDTSVEGFIGNNKCSI